MRGFLIIDTIFTDAFRPVIEKYLKNRLRHEM